jgi:hypothetical protein
MAFSRTIILSCSCLLFGCGCVVPQIHRHEVIQKLPSSNNSETRDEFPVKLLDAETKSEIKDAQVVLILSRGPAYLPDTSQGPEKSPKVIIDRFTRIDKLDYTDRELYVWPFFAVGTLYQDAQVFVYKKGYEPIPFNRNVLNPETIEMKQTTPDEGKRLLVKMATANTKNNEWKDYVAEEIKRRLK